MRGIIPIIIAMFLLVGCSMKQEMAGQEPVVNKVYVLSNTIENSEITLVFSQDATVGGSSGVNRYFAQYKIEGNKLILDYPGSTRMMGPDDLMQQEDMFLKDLSQIDTFELKNSANTLILKTTSNKELVFNLQAN